MTPDQKRLALRILDAAEKRAIELCAEAWAENRASLERAALKRARGE